MSKAWERQPKESSEAFEAFSIYLNLGIGRSYDKVRKQLGKSQTLIERWGREWGWQERIRSYDNWLVEEEDNRIKETIKQRYSRFAQLSDLAVQKASEGLLARDSNALTNADIRGLLTLGMQLADKHREVLAPPKDEEEAGDVQAAFIKAIMEDEVDYERLGHSI